MAKSVVKKRYTDSEKQNIVSYVRSQGRGGAKKAKEKYGVSYPTVQKWMKEKPSPSANSRDRKATLGRPPKLVNGGISDKKMIIIKNIVSQIIIAEERLESLRSKLATKLG